MFHGVQLKMAGNQNSLHKISNDTYHLSFKPVEHSIRPGDTVNFQDLSLHRITIFFAITLGDFSIEKVLLPYF
jgi:plastocyanin